MTEASSPLWQREPSLSIQLKYHSIAVDPILHRMYIFGGITSGDNVRANRISNALLAFDLKDGTWRTIEGCSIAGRYNHAATFAGGRMYIFGGAHLGQNHQRWDDLLEVTIADGHAYVERLQSGPSRQGHSMIFWNNLLVVFGGTDGSVYYNDCWTFNLSTNSWTCSHPGGIDVDLPFPRAYHSSVLVDNAMLVFGGGDRDMEFSNCWRLNLETFTWQPLAVHGLGPAPRKGHVTVVARATDLSYDMDTEDAAIGQNDGDELKMFVFGGCTSRVKNQSHPTDNWEYFSNMYMLGLTSLHWEMVSQGRGRTPSERSYMSACEMDGRMYVVGGGYREQMSSAVWSFNCRSAIPAGRICASPIQSPRRRTPLDHAINHCSGPVHHAVNVMDTTPSPPQSSPEEDGPPQRNPPAKQRLPSLSLVNALQFLVADEDSQPLFCSFSSDSADSLSPCFVSMASISCATGHEISCATTSLIGIDEDDGIHEPILLLGEDTIMDHSASSLSSLLTMPSMPMSDDPQPTVNEVAAPILHSAKRRVTFELPEAELEDCQQPNGCTPLEGTEESPIAQSQDVLALSDCEILSPPSVDVESESVMPLTETSAPFSDSLQGPAVCGAELQQDLAPVVPAPVSKGPIRCLLRVKEKRTDKEKKEETLKKCEAMVFDSEDDFDEEKIPPRHVRPQITPCSSQWSLRKRPIITHKDRKMATCHPRRKLPVQCTTADTKNNVRDIPDGMYGRLAQRRAQILRKCDAMLFDSDTSEEETKLKVSSSHRRRCFSLSPAKNHGTPNKKSRG